MIAATTSTAGVSTLIYIMVAVFTGLVVPAVGFLIRSTAKQLNDTTEQCSRLAQSVVQLEERQYALGTTVERHERLLESMRR